MMRGAQSSIAYRIMSAPIANFETTVGTLILGQRAAPARHRSGCERTKGCTRRCGSTEGWSAATCPPRCTMRCGGARRITFGRPRRRRADGRGQELSIRPVPVERRLVVSAGGSGVGVSDRRLRGAAAQPGDSHCGDRRRGAGDRRAGRARAVAATGAADRAVWSLRHDRSVRAITISTLAPSSTQEIDTLAASFNEMAAGLELKDRYHAVLHQVTDPTVADELDRRPDQARRRAARHDGDVLRHPRLHADDGGPRAGRGDRDSESPHGRDDAHRAGAQRRHQSVRRRRDHGAVRRAAQLRRRRTARGAMRAAR